MFTYDTHSSYLGLVIYNTCKFKPRRCPPRTVQYHGLRVVVWMSPYLINGILLPSGWPFHWLCSCFQTLGISSEHVLFHSCCSPDAWLSLSTMRRACPLSLTWAAVASCARPNLRGSSTVNVLSLLSSSFEGLGLVFQRRWAPGVHWFRPLRNRTSGPVALHDLQIIIIIEIVKVPTLRLKALNTHSITHIMYIEMENVTRN